jgi:ABC-type multidrug transport system ATPase subunit
MLPRGRFNVLTSSIFISSYCRQDDVLYKNLSVRTFNKQVFETIKYAAMLRLPSSLSNEEKLERVEHVIAVLGLQVINY